MIDDNFTDPVTAYLKGKAMQEKKTKSLDAVLRPKDELDHESSAIAEETEKLLAIKEEQKKEREAFTEEMKRGFKDLQRIEKERDQYKRLWELRGRALARPCAGCGYVQEEIKPQ